MNNITAHEFGRVAVLLGGNSNEREISLISGERVLAALSNKEIAAFAIDTRENVINQLQRTKPDRAFIALHGTGGEDGVVQGLLEVMGIPYTGSGVTASALTFDKHKAKLFWQALGLPVLPSVTIDENSDFTAIAQQIAFPWCIKPSRSGSSCGVNRVNCAEQISAAYQDARQHDDTIILESWINGREFTVGILGDRTLPVIEIKTPLEFYNYEAKYLVNSTDFICPCDLPKALQSELQRITLQAFTSAGCKGFGRVDFIQDNDGKFWLMEANTIPGLTDHSLLPMAAKKVGINFTNLILQILSCTIK